jgi:hypothetical protein
VSDNSSQLLHETQMTYICKITEITNIIIFFQFKLKSPENEQAFLRVITNLGLTVWAIIELRVQMRNKINNYVP